VTSRTNHAIQTPIQTAMEFVKAVSSSERRRRLGDQPDREKELHIRESSSHTI
jgi:hypothetical protein